MSDETLHKTRTRMRGCTAMFALMLLVLLAGCALGALGIRDGAVAPIHVNRRVGPVQLVAFVLCTSTWPADPCSTGKRTYEVWLLVDWRRLGGGNPRSYPLMITPLQE